MTSCRDERWICKHSLRDSRPLEKNSSGTSSRDDVGFERVCVCIRDDREEEREREREREGAFGKASHAFTENFAL